MKLLEDKILNEGRVINNEILKVDSFLNSQIDVKVLKEICAFFAKHFNKVDKILTIEASGIAFAIGVALTYGNVPMVFAKKSKTAVTADDEKYSSVVHSFTHNTDNHVYINKKFINPGENVLIVDDFLAEGNASLGLIDIIKQAGANPIGVAVAVEKEFQGGRKRISELNIPVVAAARIVAFKDNKPIFSKEEC